jgi:hypothetical protein
MKAKNAAPINAGNEKMLWRRQEEASKTLLRRIKRPDFDPKQPMANP